MKDRFTALFEQVHNRGSLQGARNISFRVPLRVEYSLRMMGERLSMPYTTLGVKLLEEACEEFARRIHERDEKEQTGASGLLAPSECAFADPSIDPTKVNWNGIGEGKQIEAEASPGKKHRRNRKGRRA